MRQGTRGTSSRVRVVRAMVALSMAALLPGCYGGMMVVAVGLEIDERQREREHQQRQKRIGKLPPEEQAIVYLTELGSKHRCDRIGVGEWSIDEQTTLNVTKYPLHNSKRSDSLEMYEEHFTRFGYQRVTPPAEKAVRSYQLNDYRVDLRVESPSTLHQSESGKAEDYFDLSVRVYSPRKAAKKRMR